MEEQMAALGFPVWVVVTHFFNILLLTFLLRSGIQILSDHPRLYFNDHCVPGSEWMRFTSKAVPLDRYYPSTEECVAFSPWIAIPGGRHLLGLGRNIHFFCALLWMLNGGLYVCFLFSTGQWPRLVPTSWNIFPEAWQTVLSYLSLHIPPSNGDLPYDPLQQLTYAFVVFLLAPFQIATGLALSPAIGGRFPWYPRLFGGRQAARSLHFLLMCAFVLFIFIHVSMVLLVHFPLNMAHMVLGSSHHTPLAIGIGILALFCVFLAHLFSTKVCHKNPRLVQKATCSLLNPLSRWLFSHLHSRQQYRSEMVSSYFWNNGSLCTDPEWQELEKNDFKSWRLEVKGAVKTPLLLSLDELRSLPKSTQITEHCCIQGWSGIAQWGGVSVKEILALCQPSSQARYLVFSSYQTVESNIPYYEAIEIETAQDAQTILAYEMNERPLPVANGAPLRLRVETKLGYKMTKWIRSMEVVTDLKTVGLGYGGIHEDYEYYDMGAGI